MCIKYFERLKTISVNNDETSVYLNYGETTFYMPIFTRIKYFKRLKIILVNNDKTDMFKLGRNNSAGIFNKLNDRITNKLNVFDFAVLFEFPRIFLS